MPTHESRILLLTIFGTLHKNLSALDFSLLLPDVMIIADEVDAQLTQTMESFSTTTRKSAVMTRAVEATPLYELCASVLEQSPSSQRKSHAPADARTVAKRGI